MDESKSTVNDHGTQVNGIVDLATDESVWTDQVSRPGATESREAEDASFQDISAMKPKNIKTSVLINLNQ